jgi:hypothetical protein
MNIMKDCGGNEFIWKDGVDTALDFRLSQGDIISNDCEIVNSQQNASC